MKIAVCYSGQLRLGAKAFPNHLHYFGDLINDMDFFVHTWDINTNKRVWKAKPFKVPDDMFETYKSLLKPKKFQIESFDNFNANYPSNWDVTVGFAPLYYTWYKSIQLKKQYEAETGTKYDFVIKLRTDLLLNPTRSLATEMNFAMQNNVFMAENIHEDEQQMLKVIFNDDVFWLARNDIMDQAAEYYKEHTHDKDKVLLLRYLHTKGIRFAPMRQQYSGYSIYRDECKQFHPIAEYGSCFRCERAHFSPQGPFSNAQDKDYEILNYDTMYR